MYVCMRIKFSSRRAYATHEEANRERDEKKKRRKKNNVKEKDTGGVFPFLFNVV